MHARGWRWSFAAGAAWLVASSTPLSSHHSFAAEFDSTKRIALTGTVNRIEWTNPHVYLYVDVAEPAGVMPWAVELGSPNALSRLGWTRTILKPGEAVTIDATLARYKPYLANGRFVTILATGKKLGGASSETAP